MFWMYAHKKCHKNIRKINNLADSRKNALLISVFDDIQLLPVNLALSIRVSALPAGG